MEHKLTPVLISGLCTLVFVYGVYVGTMMKLQKTAVVPVCACDTAKTATEQRVLTDNSLQLDTAWPGETKWTPRPYVPGAPRSLTVKGPKE